MKNGKRSGPLRQIKKYIHTHTTPSSVFASEFQPNFHYNLIPPQVMTKHSKNNTASSIFTYAEYKKLDYGTKKVPHCLDFSSNERTWGSNYAFTATFRK